MAGNLEIKNAQGKKVTLQNPDTNGSDIDIDLSDVASKAATDANIALKANTADFDLVNISKFTNSLSTNGYQKLPNGLIIQWGMGIAGINGTTYTNTFPIVFPAGCVSVTANHEGNANMNIVISQNLIKPASFGAIGWYPSSSITIRWIAIGY